MNGMNVTMNTLPALLRHDKGPYLGAFMESNRLNGQIRYRGPKHLLTVGPPGANKSVGIAVPNIFDLPRSMIIMDCKGQLSAITARKRATMGKVIILNPFGMFVDKMPHLTSHGFDPMKRLKVNDDKFASNAAGIAECLIEIDAQEHQKIFPEGARNLYAAMIMWERMTKGDDASIPGVRRALSASTEYKTIKKKKVPVSGFMKTLLDMAQCDFPPVANRAKRIIERFSDTASGNTSIQDKLDTALTKTDKLDEKPIARDLCGPDIDFGKFREEITTLYIILPIAELENHRIWLRLIIGTALRELYDTPLPEPERNLPPIYFLLDELAALGRLEAIETALGAARDYGIQMHVMLQFLNQIQTHYPKLWPGFFAGAGAITCFAPGDWETAEYIAKLCGQKTAMVQSTNQGTNGNNGSTSGLSWAPHGLPLIRPEDLMRLPPGVMLSMVEPEPFPFFTYAPPYPDTPYGAGLDANPYYRGRAR